MDMMQDVRGPVGDCMKGPGGPRGPSTFDTFKYEVEAFATKFGLSEWLIDCRQGEMGDDVKIETDVDYMKRHVVLTLNTKVEGCVPAKRYALLGVCHILLADIDQAMQQAEVPYITRGATLNAVVRRLMRVL